MAVGGFGTARMSSRSCVACPRLSASTGRPNSLIARASSAAVVDAKLAGEGAQVRNLALRGWLVVVL